MKTIDYRCLFGPVLAVIGAIAMLIGALDPLEGSGIILAGSGLGLNFSAERMAGPATLFRFGCCGRTSDRSLHRSRRIR